jgi:hypothetical protein
VFDGVTFAEIRSFFAFAPNFGGGVFVGAGNVNGDANIDIIVGAGAGGGPHVRVISGANSNQVQPNGQIANTALLGSFFAFAPAFGGGVTVGASDVNGDFLDDVLLGSATGTSAVKAVNATQLNNVQASGEIAVPALLQSFFAYPGFTGGVFVAGSDLNNDGRSDTITGAGPGGGPHIKGFSGVNAAEIFSTFAFGTSFLGGVRVDGAALDNTLLGSNIIAGQGINGDGFVSIIGIPLPLLNQFQPLGVQPAGIFAAGFRR